MLIKAPTNLSSLVVEPEVRRLNAVVGVLVVDDFVLFLFIVAKILFEVATLNIRVGKFSEPKAKAKGYAENGTKRKNDCQIHLEETIKKSRN